MYLPITPSERRESHRSVKGGEGAEEGRTGGDREEKGGSGDGEEREVR